MNNTPPELLEKWRQEFERFISESSDKCFNTSEENWSARNKVGRYKDRFLQFGFECWQESRQSVCIELPAVYSVDYHVIEGVRKSIEAQGYTTN